MRRSRRSMLTGSMLAGATLALLLATGSMALAKKRHPFRMALSMRNISWVDPVSAKAVSRTLMAEIGRQAGYEFDFEIYRHTAGEMLARLISGHHNIGISGALEYVQTALKLKVVPLSREYRFGKPSFKILLLVHKDSQVKRIADLKGKKLSLSDDDPINRVYLRVLLARNGIKDSARFFSSIETKVKPKAAVLDLFLQESDACLATDTVFNAMTQLNPQLKKTLRPIHYSPAISNGTIYVRAPMPSKHVQNLTKALLTLHQTAKGKQLLKIFRTSKMVSVTDRDYDSARKIWREYQALEQR